MATEFVGQKPVVTGIDTGRVTVWIKSATQKLLAKKKHLLIGGVAIVALAAAGFYFWGGHASAAQYLSAKVERGNLRNTVTATGTLQAVTTVQVGSQASGTISALYADY